MDSFHRLDAIMTTALTEYKMHRPEAWKSSDGEGEIIGYDQNRFPFSYAYQVWKVVEPVFEDLSLPAQNTFHSDAQAFWVLNHVNDMKLLGQRWPGDFTQRGLLQAQRVPKTPAVWVRKNGKLYYPILDYWYLMHGSGPVSEKKWHLARRSGDSRTQGIWVVGDAPVGDVGKFEQGYVADFDPNIMTWMDEETIDVDSWTTASREVFSSDRPASVASSASLTRDSVIHTDWANGVCHETYRYVEEDSNQTIKREAEDDIGSARESPLSNPRAPHERYTSILRSRRHREPAMEVLDQGLAAKAGYQ